MIYRHPLIRFTLTEIYFKAVEMYIKKIAARRNRISMAISMAALLPSTSALAIDTREIQSPQGTTLFKVNFYDMADGEFLKDPEGKLNQSSSWNLDPDKKEKIESGLRYWATVLSPIAGQLPAVINVGTTEDANAAAASFPSSEDQSPSIKQLQAALTNNTRGPKDYGADGFFLIGKLNFDTQTYLPAQLPRTGSFDLAGTATHELAHALGVSSSVEDKNGKDSKTPYFDKNISLWTSHLRDDNGNSARPDQVVLCTGCNNAYDPDGFDVRKDQGYFTGKNVSEVLAGAMPGIPVRVLTDGEVDDNYMSHIELKNSLMSHQSYRNYTTFMEAEIAALQDLGYKIDRRNLFGHSVYGDNQVLYNQNGYFQRDPDGTRYLVGNYSQTLLGLGLHVYGNYNQIFQQADLLTRGAGAAGARIDGEGNTLVVAPGTRIHANGENGVGVLFAYGKDHALIQRGDIEALGEGGVAAKFSFGQNLLGSLGEQSEYRGSYFQFKNNAIAATPLPELMGALVNDVDISGRLAGKNAAIQIDDSALVNRINILAGTQLEGGIYSNYNAWQGVEQRYTQLNFGLLGDGQGHALTQADPNFRITYNDDIQGIKSLVMNLKGGETTLNGKDNQLYSVNVAEGATLTGNGTYKIHDEGSFINSGHIAPGTAIGTMTVNGNFQQTDSGRLLMEVNSLGQHDSLVVNGETNLAGSLTVAPLRGWYSPNWTLSTAALLSSTRSTGDFNVVELAQVSPTLSLLTVAQDDGSKQLSMRRLSNAYSQYALSKNGAAVGNVLSQSATEDISTDRQNLYTSLDFSAADGSTVGKVLEQLSPSAYSAMMSSSLQREQHVADAISALEPGKLREHEWQTFIQPFGGNSKQQGQRDVVGYTTRSHGVIFGAQTATSPDGALIAGLHGAASEQNLSLRDPQHGNGNSSTLQLGAHVRYALDPMLGTYWLGNARAGYESGAFKRKIDFDDYSARNKADWTGKSVSVVGGGGYRFKLNENASMGPVASLTYTSLWRDEFHEKGNAGARLKLNSQKFNSLRSSVGLNSAMRFPLEGGRAVKGEGQITWNHEFLNTELTQDATFATAPGSSFHNKNTITDRDSMGLRGDIRYSLSENVDVGAGVSTDLLRDDYNAVAGNLSLDWRF